MPGFRDALAAFFSPAPGMEPPSYTVLDVAVRVRGLNDDALFGVADPKNTVAAGVTVNAETAIRNIAVQAAVRLLTNDIGSLPVNAYRKDGKGRQEITLPTWINDPNPMDPNEEWEDHIKQVVYALLTDGHNFTRCFPSRFNVEGIEVLEPANVDIDTFRGRTVYNVRGEGSLSPSEIVSIPLILPPGKKRGLNPIEAAKQGLGIALASDEFVGSYFGNGAVPSSWIKVPPGVDLNDDQIRQLKSQVKREHVGKGKYHAVGALTGGAELVAFDYNNRDAQLLELRDQIVEDVARLFLIPPHMLGSQKPGAVGYASVEQRSIDYTAHAVLPITRRIQRAYSRLLRGQQTYLKLNLRGLLAGDAQSRAAYYDSMLQNKVLRREEVRELEDLDFDPEGVGYLETPNNNAPEEPPAEPAA